MNQNKLTAIYLGNKQYSTGKPCKNGHLCNRYVSNNICVECDALKVKSNPKRRFYSLKYQQQNRDLINSKNKKYRAENREKIKTRYKKWCDKNRPLRAEYNARRRLCKNQAVPLWANIKAIKDIYKKARSLNLTVDHIVPLNSFFVCGLHTEANLQLMSFEENSGKRNRFWPDMPKYDKADIEELNFTNDLISIAEDGDRAIIKLTACQNILKGLSL